MEDNSRKEVQTTIKEVFAAMEEKGYDPLGQILRFVLSGNPAFITRYKGARDIIVKMDRQTLLNGVADYAGYVRNLAYRDVLTGTNSKASYYEITNQIKEDIDANLAHFCIVICDINGLKTINDQHGHATGDVYICAMAQILMKVFGNNKVYRIGGDEFAVILKKYNELEKQLEDIDAEITDFNVENDFKDCNLEAALGHSEFAIGDTYETVFARADGNMYLNKQMKKLNRLKDKKSSNPVKKKYVMTVDEYGNPMVATDEEGNPIAEGEESGTFIVKIDENGNPQVILDENGETLIVTDENGNPITVMDEYGNRIAAIDENGNPIEYYRYTSD